jgi:beta-glucosidase/6-phospho-beta-glucosidase/beta-galactosidase
MTLLRATTAPGVRDPPGSGAREFLWATGIEDTFVPQARPGFRALDEYQLVGHYEHWREDLALLRELGVQAVRWGVPWYRVEAIPGVFDWSWTDRVADFLLDELGVTPIVDLMHYGCPYWLRREFASSEYPLAVAEWSRAFAARYAGRLRWYTPFNEPLVNALLCGKRGLFPPYLRGDRGYLRVLMQVVDGIRRSVAALRAEVPDAVLVHVEAAGLSRAARHDLHVLAVEEQRRGYLAYDLLTGRVDEAHPLFTWLLRNDAGLDLLGELVRHPVTLDLMGLNFYPQWSTQQLYVTRGGRLRSRSVEQDGEGFTAMIEDYWRRYQVPVMVTETSARGDLEVRSRWLAASVAAVRQLRERGIPVVGYTWFPLFTMVDWRYRYGRRPVDDYRLELGLYTLRGSLEPNAPTAGGRWEATPLVEQYRRFVADPAAAVGTLAAAPAT